MTKRTWHSGKPPCVGWYQSSYSRIRDLWRWWNGKTWSEYATQGNSAEIAALYAERLASEPDDIEWTTYWPKNARVPDTRNLKGYK